MVLCLRFHHAAEINHTALKKRKYTNSLNLNVSQRNVFMLGLTFKQVAATAVMFSFNIIFDMKNCREIDIYIIKITFKQAHSFNIF